MFEAVLHISKEMLTIGENRKNVRMMAISLLNIGELIVQ